MTAVVVPLFNRLDLTLACVDSLAAHAPEVELILVDNGSTDLTSDLQVRLRNVQNLGFARACNQGALMVSTSTLVTVFLNSDTEVSEGWLAALLAPFADPEVGIVGARLLYPDGSLQHAGVSVDFARPPGAEARNITADLGIGSYEVDAVTGACLAIRTQLFRELGGFDEEFWNGYEDIDLCLRAKQAGARIVYQPDAIALHHESASGPERWAKVKENVRLLRERWGSE